MSTDVETQQFEYKVVESNSGIFSTSVDERGLNELGERGWEMVGTVIGVKGNGSETKQLIFKRPL